MVKITMGFSSDISSGVFSCFFQGQRRNFQCRTAVQAGEPLLQHPANLCSRLRIKHGLMIAGQFMDLRLACNKWQPRRWTAMDDLVQIAQHLRGVKIQQVRCSVMRTVLTRQFQIVEHHRRQIFEEFRIIFHDHLRDLHHSLMGERNGVSIVRMQQELTQFLQCSLCLIFVQMDIHKSQSGLYFFCFGKRPSELRRKKEEAVNHGEQLHAGVLLFQQMSDAVSNESTHGAAQETIRPLRLNAPDLFHIVGGDFLNAGWEVASAQAAGLQTVDRNLRAEVPQQAGKAQTDSRHGMNAEQRAVCAGLRSGSTTASGSAPSRLMRSTMEARLAMVGASNNVPIGSSISKLAWKCAINSAAESESPPRSKKLSCRPTRSAFRTSCQIKASFFSTGVAGSTYRFVLVHWGTGRAFRSNFPLGVRGMASRSVRLDGIMWPGRRPDRNERTDLMSRDLPPEGTRYACSEMLPSASRCTATAASAIAECWSRTLSISPSSTRWPLILTWLSARPMNSSTPSWFQRTRSPVRYMRPPPVVNGSATKRVAVSSGLLR